MHINSILVGSSLVIMSNICAAHGQYSVLVIGSKIITTNGKIDLAKWKEWRFPHAELISVGQGADRMEYLPADGRYYLMSGPRSEPNIVTEEMEARFDKSLVGDKLKLINGQLNYLDKKLKYKLLQTTKTPRWGKGFSEKETRGFRFQNYLIFLIQNSGSDEDDYDFVCYDLETGNYSLTEMYSVWPMVWMLSKKESVGDPRQKPVK